MLRTISTEAVEDSLDPGRQLRDPGGVVVPLLSQHRNLPFECLDLISLCRCHLLGHPLVEDGSLKGRHYGLDVFPADDPIPVHHPPDLVCHDPSGPAVSNSTQRITLASALVLGSRPMSTTGGTGKTDIVVAS